MEWNGMEWNGMEWNGMEWNGMEWNGAFYVAIKIKDVRFLLNSPLSRRVFLV
jgi:hypothetical protein